MKKAKFIRKRNVIRDAISGEPIFTKPTVNAAKRESRRLQMSEDGGLGRGSLKKEKS